MPSPSDPRIVTLTITGATGTVTVDWGDGTSSPGMDPNEAHHTYTAAGRYTVTVSDDTGARPDGTAQVVVPVRRTVTAALTGTGETGGPYTLAAVFTLDAGPNRTVTFDAAGGQSGNVALVAATPSASTPLHDGAAVYSGNVNLSTAGAVDSVTAVAQAAADGAPTPATLTLTIWEPPPADVENSTLEISALMTGAPQPAPRRRRQSGRS